MSLAEREPLTMDDVLGTSSRPTMGFRGLRALDAPLPRASLGRVVVLLDVLLGLFALSLAGLVVSSAQAAVTGAALLAATALFGRSRATTLAVAGGVLDELPRVAQIAAVATMLAVIGQGAVSDPVLNAPVLLGTWSLLALVLVLSQGLGRALARHLVEPERCLLVGPVERCEAFERSLETEGLTSLSIVGRVDSADLGSESAGLQPIEELLNAQRATRVIVLCGGDPARAAQAARRGRNAGVRVSLAQESMESVGAPHHIEHVGSSVLLSVLPSQTAIGPMPGKRALDVVGATLALVALAPIMLAVAAAIRLTSSGPVLFWQDRIGLDGRRFRIAKFRTMVADAEAMKDALRDRNEAGGGLFKMADDPRITRVGRLLRRTSLDELPQLINVLRGDMSLVGPRPLVCDEDALVGGWYRDRLRLKPGMTGRWQILGSARIPMHEMVALDQQYVAGWSLWLDLRILLRTALFVARRRGL